jgi:purine-nucleoside phosphorylase
MHGGGILRPDQLREKLFGPEIVPKWGLVLGSGFNIWQGNLSETMSVPFDEVDGVENSTVYGHIGCFSGGFLDKIPVVVSSGRLHLYEGYTAEQVTAPTRVLVEMGVSSVLLTTAVGAVSNRVSPGEAVAVIDQINLTAEDPHAGSGRFTEASTLYDRVYIDVLLSRGLGKGVLAGVRGPTYESPAEVRALRILGADMVCMSTVLEVLTLAAYGIRCAALAVVANRAGTAGTDHEDIVKEVQKAASKVWKTVGGLIDSGS